MKLAVHASTSMVFVDIYHTQHYINTCIYTYLCVYVYIYIYIYIYIYMCICIYTHVCVYLCIYTIHHITQKHTQTHMFMYVHLCIYTTHIPHYTNIHILTPVYMYTVIQWLVWFLLDVFTETLKLYFMYVYMEDGPLKITTYRVSQVVARILPIWDPAMLIIVSFFYGNVFYIVNKQSIINMVAPFATLSISHNSRWRSRPSWISANIQRLISMTKRVV